ncbi:DUF4442 domain-containing protein [Mobilicoccus pelagius]|uniref:Thioesterase putative domain-containing protein n=1 Tax=Mobilicoccus pelagius NBRC 104925 TaxID=1089455 RepID=H5UQL2_9MICO|nr:DUF4442 domain-containing protein [Mobilicoccus pelagius]GAB48020.1 hypothetical protein MOPEL_032_00620 [Mobilicoccus pelagius NBRC 104925]
MPPLSRARSTITALPGTLTDRMPQWRDVLTDPVMLRRFLNVWPPFRFAGIRVVEIERGFRGATVELKLTPLSRNYVGTQFGGSMFSMSDPFWMILVGQRLGRDYIVWDKRAEIEFVSPGRTDVRTTFTVTDELVEELRAKAERGAKVLHWVENDIVDREGTLVARVRRQLYVRHKDHTRGY